MCRIPAVRLRFAVAALATVLGLILLPGLARSEEARPDLRRCFPASGLIAYAEFDGLRTHTKAWEATAAYAMLARTPAGSMMTDLATQVVDRLLKVEPSIKWTGADLLALEDHIVQQGLAMGYRLAGEDEAIILVVRGAGQPASRERFERVLGLADARAGREKSPAVSRIRGRETFRWMSTMTAIPADDPVAPLRGGGIPEARLSAWFEKNDLVLVASNPPIRIVEAGKKPDDMNGRAVAAVLDTIEGKQPNVTTHPGLVSATAEGKDVTGFEADGLFFIELAENLTALERMLPLRTTAEPVGMASGSAGLTLPSGRYMQDDVQYIQTGDDFQLPFLPSGPDIAAIPPAAPAVVRQGRLDPPALPPPTVGQAAIPPSTIISPIDAPPEAAPAAPSETPSPAAAPSPCHTVRPYPSAVLPELMPVGTSSVRPARPAEPRPAPEAAGRKAGRPPQDDPIKALGLDGIKRIVGRWGFHGKALLTDVRVEIPTPRTGLAGGIDQPGFDRDRLLPVPDRARSFTVDSMDPAQMYARLADLGKAIDPNSTLVLAEAERIIKGATGLRLREDLLAQIGPSWSVFPAPSAERNDKDELDPWDYVLVADLKDAGAFAKTLDTLVARASDYLHEREKPKGAAAPAAGQADLPAVALERLPAPHRGYRLTSPSEVVFWLDEEIQPTILVGRSHVAFASTPERAVEALVFEQGDERRWKPMGEVEQALACLPRKLTLLSIGDNRESSIPALIVGLPRIVQMLSTAEADLESPAGEGRVDFLTMIGIPGPERFRVRIDPARLPKAEALEAHLFPNVLAAAVDDQGIRFIAREAFPLCCLRNGAYLKPSVEWSDGGWKRDLKMGVNFLGGR